MNEQIHEFQAAVVSAVNTERRATPNVERFQITEVAPVATNGGLRIRLRPLGMVDDDIPAMVDERFRMARACWISPEGTPCQCDAQIDETEDDVVLLDWRSPKALHGAPWLELECFDFLYATERAWSRVEVAEAAFDSYQRLSHPECIDTIALEEHSITRHLSESQMASTALVGYDHAWLFGPPGTGKTATCAVLLAAYLMAKPQPRILLVGVSNAPLCQLVLKLDQVLQGAGRNDLRGQMRRYGPVVSQELRVSAPHLLPHPKDEFMPAAKGFDAPLIASIDAEIFPEPLSGPPRLLAMTVSMAIQKRSALEQLAPFDLLVIEEASQAPLAQTLLLSSMAKVTVYAGDPKQLSPVAKSADQEVRRWMARSPMMCMPDEGHSSIVQLTEQRRMAPEICRLVAAIGYGGKLFTAEACLVDPIWAGEHYMQLGHWGKDQSIAVHEVKAEHAPSRLIRDSSARAIIEMLQAARSSHLKNEDFLILTPFRAQVQWIRFKLRQANIRNVRVATVHRVQGKESAVVIFDPVCGRHPFLHTEEATRLLTVAFSRAKAKLILVGSRQDLEHPLLERLALSSAFQYNKCAA